MGRREEKNGKGEGKEDELVINKIALHDGRRKGGMN